MNDNDDIKMMISSSRDKKQLSSSISLDTTIENKLKLWRRKLSRRKTTTISNKDIIDNDNIDDDDDIMPTGDCEGLANNYNIVFRNVTDLHYLSSNINNVIMNNSKTLIVLELSRCGIYNDDMINIISNCISLRWVNMESNLLTNIPLCLTNLKELQYLNLKRNQIGAMAGDNQGYNYQPYISKEVKEVILRLKLLPNKLIYMNTSLNPIATIKQHVYRTLMLKSVPSLLALDSHIYSDDEHHIIKSYNIKLDSPYIAGHYSLRVPVKMTSIPSQFVDSLALVNTTLKIMILPITETADDYCNKLNNLFDNRHKFMLNIRKFTSPISSKQRLIRRWILSRRHYAFKKIMPILQAHIRRKLFIWRVHHEMLSILQEEKLGHLLVAENIGLTPEQIRLRVSKETIKKFLRHCFLKMRHYKSAIKIQKKFRTIINLKKSHTIWLQRNMITGILVTTDCSHDVEIELEELLRRRNTGHDINTYKFEDIAMKELIEAVKEHKAIDTMSTYKSTDYDGTFYKENVNNLKLHRTTSYHKIKRKNIKKVLYQPLPRTKHPGISVLNKRSHIGKQAGTFRILQHLRRFTEYSRAYYTLKPRGNIISYDEKQDVAYLRSNKTYRYYETAMPLTALVFNDIRVLCDIGLTLRSKNIRFSYNTVVYKNAAAMVIQRAYRGLTVRRSYAKKFIQKLLRRRATIALQRWWRQMNTLIRRLKFHDYINACCRSLSSSVVYLDAWTFFTALKAETLPDLCNEIKLFPEFRGVPSVDKDGHCGFKYLRRDYMEFIESKLEKEHDQSLKISESKLELSVSDSSQSIHYNKDNDHPSLFENSTVYFNANDRTRFGLPKWAAWSPSYKISNKNDLPNIINSRNDEKFALFDIITKGASICAKIITPKYPDDLRKHLQETVSTDGLGLHVIELKFRNIQEAREHCAMLMIASYDYRTRTSIIMCSADDMIKKINSRVTDIAKALLLTNKSLSFNNNNDDDFYDDVEFEIGGSYDPNKSRIGSHITPVEIKVQFNHCPRWVHEYEYTIRDLVRFRFMCESLRQYGRSRQVIQKSQFNDMDKNPLYDIMDPAVLVTSTENSNHIITGSLEASQVSLDTNNQDSHRDRRYILDWDADMPSIYANTRSMYSSINVDAGLPIPIVPTDSIGNMDQKDFAVMFDYSIEKPTRPKSSPKLASHFKAVENDDTIARLLLWCSRDNEFDVLKGGYDEKKLNLFSLTAPFVLGSTDQSSTVRLETIILAEYYSYVKKCNSRRSESRKPGSASSIIRPVSRSENVVDIIHKEYDEHDTAPQILYNVRRVFGCKESTDTNPSDQIDYKEKLAQLKYDAAIKIRQEKEIMAKRLNVMHAFEDCVKQDIVRNVIKSRGQSREKIAQKLLERESKSREGKSKDGISAGAGVEGNSREGSKASIKVANDMNAFHDQRKQKLRENVLVHKQQKKIKESERLFCQNLQKSFASLIKKTATDKAKKIQQQQQMRPYNDQDLHARSVHSSAVNNVKESDHPATLSLASNDKGSYRLGGPDMLVSTNVKQVRVSFSDLSHGDVLLKPEDFDGKVVKMVTDRRKESPTKESPTKKRTGSFSITLPSILSSTTTNDAKKIDMLVNNIATASQFYHDNTNTNTATTTTASTNTTTNTNTNTTNTTTNTYDKLPNID